MDQLIPYIWLAGIVHIIIAVANLVLPTKLDYKQKLAKVSPIIRQIFFVHSGYIVLILVGFGLACLFFAPELAGGSTLGVSLSAFMAAFWVSRVFVHGFYYDRATKRQYPILNAAFLVAITYLAVVFLAALLAGLRG